MEFIVPFQPQIGGGGVITVVGDSEDQALYWELVSVDPATGLEGAPLGSLAYSVTRTGGNKLSVNLYVASTDPADAGWTDRVKVRYA